MIASVIALASLLAVVIYMVLPIQAVRPDPASWANPVGCLGHTAEGSTVPKVVSIPQILGSAYPNQSLLGSVYDVNAKDGGISDKRALEQPCSIINSAGENVTVYVEIDNVWLSGYEPQTPEDCLIQTVNGTLCDAVGNIFDPTMPHSCYHLGCIHVEMDQYWIYASQLPAGYPQELNKYACGSSGSGCMLGPQSSCFARNGESGVCLDFQGFVYWDSEEPVRHWELHPLTAWRLQPGPVSLISQWLSV